MSIPRMWPIFFYPNSIKLHVCASGARQNAGKVKRSWFGGGGSQTGTLLKGLWGILGKVK